MTEVRIAPPAGDARPHHAETAILRGFDILLRDRLPEARPARVRIVFRLRGEQSRAATHTTIQAFIVQVPVAAGEWALRCRVPSDL